MARNSFTAQALRIAIGLLLSAASALASGPRWVTGPPYFTGPSGVPVVWYTLQPHYFTDPGDLSASVNHAAADAIVAAAAGVWNVPTAGITIAYGGMLDQHVSAANSYLGSNGPVFPQDVQADNFVTKQIAVLYDSDGSVTDMLLGSGASSPQECRQNAVTESVDSIIPSGVIQHAILVLNGRCTGPAPEQQLQMQYQLERAFGRILGLGWSQTNDNVFTRTPQPTYSQAMHWPILHPIDILCGQYTYQCLPQPFTLRDDDVASITSLYPQIHWDTFPAVPPAPGKAWSYQQASVATGTVTFPTGQGMQGVDVVLQREQGGVANPEAWYDVSAVTGVLYQQNAGNPVLPTGSGIATSMGSTDPGLEGYYRFGWIPDLDPAGSYNGPMMAIVTTEPINPLYVGAYSIGPYVEQNVSSSGAAQSEPANNALYPYQYGWSGVEANFAPRDAAANCSTGDGTESSPQPVPPNGWWTGVLCAHGHAAWSSFAAKAGRSATLEVTALDENGLATTNKAMPLIGVWAATDATGTLPTVAATPFAFNTVSPGMTAASISTTTSESLRFVLVDARGGGRPDFTYRARLLYADSVQPAILSANGGQITVTGMGFHAGDQVTINGVVAVVTSWTPTAIIAVAPPQSAFRSDPTRPVDLTVTDLTTRGTALMSAALTYSNIAPDVMTLVSAPSGSNATGAPAVVPFAVRVLLGDGVTPVTGLPVTFTAISGNVLFAPCSSTPCTVLTDASGFASTSVIPTAFGSITIQASAVGAQQTATFNAVTRSILPTLPVERLAAGAIVTWTPQVTTTENGAPAPGIPVQWTAPAGMSLSPASSQTDAFGIAQTTAASGPLAPGAQTIGQACAWNSFCVGFTAIGVDPSAWRLAIVSGSGQSASASAALDPVVLVVADPDGNPIAGAPVVIHQTADAAEMPCPIRGRCPIAPILAISTIAGISDANGLVSVTAMQLPGTAEVTNIAVAAGTQGFVSLSLRQGP
jgi:hypothetical protein